MACRVCNVEKLSNEFPPTTVLEECDHPSLVCLRCVVNFVKDKKQCPHETCTLAVDPDCENMKWFEAILREMFTEYTTEFATPIIGPGDKVINITVLNGESMQLPYNPAMAVYEVKGQIQSRFNHDIAKQKLLYQEKELKNGTLKDNDVQPNATIYLVILLMAIPKNLDHVIFDLQWDYPSSGRDMLDASCLAYQNKTFLRVFDWFSGPSRFFKASITHSGDKLDEVNRKGHHTIDVRLKQLPNYVTHLFFTLSAWASPDIGKFPNPSLRFYDASNSGIDLCSTTFTHATNSQAVVMCSVSKNKGGQWEIYESGKLSSGNADDYTPLRKTIKELIQKGF